MKRLVLVLVLSAALLGVLAAPASAANPDDGHDGDADGWLGDMPF